MARPRKPLLTRDRIVATALRLVDAEGLQAVSTRRLAAELGVSGPSLYHHFRTKDDILDAVADTVCAPVEVAMFDNGSPWPAALVEWARSYRAALRAHPHIVPYLAQGPGRRPSQLRMADAVFGAMTRAGWSRAQATHIGAAMRYFVAGSALGSFARGFVDDAALYARDYPHLDQAHLLAEHQQQVDDGAFETGLRALVDGLIAQYAEGPGRTTAVTPAPEPSGP
ncbi:TetR/AcrR family transcriptional regulator C-terminal domain-containing protein [Streptomyces sp. ACA25]|uniref:TetR/AcrR family transcriptional regulator n=1 Tax=Streptomyces sp. ACA25 TaxID=3022596 RepID=UPI00230820BC|nr:TetR/AcrR family transcriptional regulator C-terminal domain-containing protein [Streptomyces sp. ACA25]MDB1089082.1 TetR/AcrR family transcriptional regulator C-terminal domain-containing protein [Streptomyces sp. ACA25]